MKHFRLSLCLGVAGAISAGLLFPYLLAIMPDKFAAVSAMGVGIPTIIAGQVVQAFVLFTLMSWAGLRLGSSMGLDAPMLRSLVYGTPRAPSAVPALVRACLIGFACGIVVALVDSAVQPFMPAALAGAPPPVERWKGFLASFYGGIGEEITLRLFVMTLLMWAAWKVLARGSAAPPASAAWIAIVLAALLFAAGHLPTAAGIWPLDTVVVLRTLSLNAIVGIVCGWLYYRRGLEHAMAGHFCADIILHVAVA